MSFDDTNTPNVPEEVPSEASENQPQEEQHLWDADETSINHLPGMYREWFLDYASYVILERAVPHINDGLKPVQRRILHAMRRMDDGRYNKVANIIGFTMQFHPHGDASIGDALVQLGQKDLLIDCQGNWGNVYTGDSAAAPRYIEARLTKFAQEVVFNPKTTEWKQSYDGRNNEPITLPVKFPLLLAQGVEGIAVGLASKLLPHNFNELIDASVNYLENKPFEIFPDFPTGGMVDVSRYNDGLRGGAVKVRAKIGKVDSKTLVISDIPYGKNTTTLIESILKANDKGKIKIKKIDDNTAENVEILVYLPAGASPDKTIDALYAFTDCEVSISPNACVIQDNKPYFIGVSEILKENTDNTVQLLKRELEIRKGELEEAWHMSSLERIFIENKIYQRMEDCETMEAVVQTIDHGLEPFKNLLRREVTRDDIVKLTQIRMIRISKFDAKKADEYIASLEEEMEQIAYHLANLITYAIDYFKHIKKQYGKNFPRKTEIRSFANIEATKVVVKNEKLYINREDGFVGTSLRKDEYVCDCSDIDDIIIFYKDGKYIITKVSDKAFVGKDIIHIAVFKKNDKRTIYNAVYQDGKGGIMYMKRFAVTGVTRDKDYHITKETPGSKLMYFSANPNGESEILKVVLRPKARIRNLVFDVDMGELAIKGRAAMGNILTKHEVKSISLKRKGESTLGGRKIWFEHETLRLNADGRGQYLGEFHGGDQVLIITKDGKYHLTSYDLSNHYEDNILIIEKYKSDVVWSAVYFDAEQNYYYIKRFQFENSARAQSFIGDNPKSRLVKIMHVDYPRLEVKFGGDDKLKEKLIVEVAEFIGVKSFKAKGKRLTTFQVSKIQELEPLVMDEPKPDEQGEAVDEHHDEDDENQMSLFNE
ncbi:DNA gyrase/topoisomerase IV subunit A [Carboxylicivirga sediminis]|uniref:DNA gyrase/topoisomerase IV subunit A n=1 Tax=Carboxylicivirga sediminis TaxID=2006564 RepID=A0A941J0J8_9BACT|nr:DNA gyrase/topoisomerase IV subunit A [Carboxylicivirga sediminis]MBR8538168.1 DNA gyrase/topoisomerase IV subunit A [Carboxylicivirga sediminis]